MLRSQDFLSSSETLQLRTGPHPVVMNGALSVAMALASAAVALTYGAIHFERPYSGLAVGVSFVLLLASLGVTAKAMLRRFSQVVLVTDRRVIEIRGIWSRTVRDIRIEALQTVTVDQSMFGRVFNFGTVTLQVGNDTPMVLEDIAFPLELHQALQDCRSEQNELALV